MKSPIMQALLRGKESKPLKAITFLRKLVNHPDLLNLREELEGCEDTWPEGYDQGDKRRKLDPELSGKMAVLSRCVQRSQTMSTEHVTDTQLLTQLARQDEGRDGRQDCAHQQLHADARPVRKALPRLQVCASSLCGVTPTDSLAGSASFVSMARSRTTSASSSSTSSMTLRLARTSSCSAPRPVAVVLT